jgi:hypothetical protein
MKKDELLFIVGIVAFIAFIVIVWPGGNGIP